VTPFSDAARQRIAQLAAGLQARGLDPTEALGGAYELIEKTLAAQSAVLAFRDCYLLIFCLFLLLVPLIPLLKRPEAPPLAPVRPGMRTPGAASQDSRVAGSPAPGR
jgi:hypothetical protein